MTNEILGIHHVTALCSSPAENLNFYRNVLGLRLVKKTVNFDNPLGYHFYYGDRTGKPGTLMTFFPSPHWKKGIPGSREVARTDFAVPAGSLGFWSDRLKQLGVAITRVDGLNGQPRVEFTDHDHTRLSIVEDNLSEVNAEPSMSTVPQKHAITGIASVAIRVNQAQDTVRFLTDSFGFKSLGQVGNSAWFGVSAHVPGQKIEVIEDAAVAAATLGNGSVHHVAWRVADDASQARVVDAIRGHVFSVTEMRDRNYFRSVYFREPGHVIFEVATDAPGFLIDEDEATLGEALKLPKQFEPRRAEIESALSENE